MEFAKTHLEKPIKTKRIIFDNEAHFTIRAPATYRKTLMCWDQKRKQKKLPDYHQKVSVWGAIGYNFKSKLICFRTKVNGEFYSSIIQDNLIKRLEEEKLSDRTLITDNAPWHSSAKVKDFLAKSSIMVLSLPPYSPDLNPIENFWSLIKQKVYEHGRSYETCLSLELAIMKAWDEYSQEKINEMMIGYRGRLIAVVEEHGCMTKR
jgi:transposase